MGRMRADPARNPQEAPTGPAAPHHRRGTPSGTGESDDDGWPEESSAIRGHLPAWKAEAQSHRFNDMMFGLSAVLFVVLVVNFWADVTRDGFAGSAPPCFRCVMRQPPVAEEPRHALERYHLLVPAVWDPPARGQPRASVNMTWRAGTPHRPSSTVDVVFTCVAVNRVAPHAPGVRLNRAALRDAEMMVRSIVLFSPRASLRFFAVADAACERHLRNLTQVHGWPPDTIRGHPIAYVRATRAALLRVAAPETGIPLERWDGNGTLLYGLAAFATHYAHALLPDVDFAVVVDLDVVFLQDIRLLWREFARFTPQEVFAHARQDLGRDERVFATPPNVWDSYNAGVQLVNFAKYRQLLSARPPRRMEQAFVDLAAGFNNTPHWHRWDPTLWCAQKVQIAYHYWYPQHVHVLPQGWNAFACCAADWQLQARRYVGALHKPSPHVAPLTDLVYQASWDATYGSGYSEGINASRGPGTGGPGDIF